MKKNQNEKQEDQINDFVGMMVRWGKEIAEYQLIHTLPHIVETESEG